MQNKICLETAKQGLLIYIWKQYILVQRLDIFYIFSRYIYIPIKVRELQSAAQHTVKNLLLAIVGR